VSRDFTGNCFTRRNEKHPRTAVTSPHNSLAEEEVRGFEFSTHGQFPSDSILDALAVLSPTGFGTVRSHGIVRVQLFVHCGAAVKVLDGKQSRLVRAASNRFMATSAYGVSDPLVGHAGRLSGWSFRLLHLETLSAKFLDSAFCRRTGGHAVQN